MRCLYQWPPCCQKEHWNTKNICISFLLSSILAWSSRLLSVNSVWVLSPISSIHPMPSSFSDLYFHAPCVVRALWKCLGLINYKPLHCGLFIYSWTLGSTSVNHQKQFFKPSLRCLRQTRLSKQSRPNSLLLPCFACLYQMTPFTVQTSCGCHPSVKHC